MKTLQEIKDDFATEMFPKHDVIINWSTFLNYYADRHAEWFNQYNDEVSKRYFEANKKEYATECVKASQELIADNANILLSYEEDGIKHSISIHETNFDSTKNRKHVCVDKDSITSPDNIVLL